MTAARLIGIDVGTSSAKGVVIDERGAVLEEAEHPIPISMPHPGWSEQDPEDWWTATEAVLRNLDGDAADGIGLSGQMHGLVALGADRRPLRPAILWNDGRSQPQATRIEQELGIERLVALSGNRALAGFTAPKLTWLAEHEPDVHAPHRADPPAQGLRPLPAHRRAGHRRLRRFGNGPAGCRPPSLERRAGRGLRRRP